MMQIICEEPVSTTDSVARSQKKSDIERAWANRSNDVNEYIRNQNTHLPGDSDLSSSDSSGIVIDTFHSDWPAQCKLAIRNFLHLPREWNSYDSPIPNHLAVDLASNLVSYLSSIGLKPDIATPTAEGGVGMTFRRGNRLASLEIDNDGEVLALTEFDGGTPAVWSAGTKIPDIYRAIAEVERHLKNASRQVEDQGARASEF